MRDIEDYEIRYRDDGFEYYQAKYRKKKILEIIHKYPHKSMLEIGCGLDPLFNYVDDYDTYTFFEPGKDFYANAIEMAGNNNRIIGINDGFVADDRTANKNFDMIICSSLLHELEHPEAMVKDIVSICDNDTVVHINVPNSNSFHRVLAREMGMIDDVHMASAQNIKFQQHIVFDMQSLNNLVTSEGLSVVEKGGYFIKPFTHQQMYQMLQSGIIDEKVLNGLYNMAPLIEEYASEIYVNCKIQE